MLKNPEKCDAPVVALHSSASSSSQWNSLIVDLDDRHDVIAYDLPGYGSNAEQNKPFGGPFGGMTAIARTVLKKILELDRPVHLVGHSFGGGVAIKTALMRPELVKSLTLYEPVAFHILKRGGRVEQFLLRDLEIVEEALVRSIAEGRPNQGMRVFVDFWSGDGAWDRMSKEHRQKLTTLASSVAMDFANGFAESWTVDELADLTMPVLMLMGMESPAVSQRTTSLIVANTPGAELAMLPGLGHMAPVFASQWVNPRIKQHIARVDRSAAYVGWPKKSAA